MATSYLIDGGRSYLAFSRGEKILSESERSELKLLKLLQRQENIDRSKVSKFKLYYSREFLVLKSTKISNTFFYNAQTRDVIK